MHMHTPHLCLPEYHIRAILRNPSFTASGLWSLSRQDVECLRACMRRGGSPGIMVSRNHGARYEHRHRHLTISHQVQKSGLRVVVTPIKLASPRSANHSFWVIGLTSRCMDLRLLRVRRLIWIRTLLLQTLRQPANKHSEFHATPTKQTT